MSQLTVVAKLRAKSGFEAQLHQELLKMIPPTLAEEGCLNYDLHRSIEDDSLFLLYENWESKLIWDQHMSSEHMLGFRKNTEGAIADWELFLMRPEKPH